MKKLEHSYVRKKYIERQSMSDNNNGLLSAIAGFDENCPEGEVEWYELNFDSGSGFINKIFYNLLGTDNLLGISLNDLIVKYTNKVLPEKHIQDIDKIRANPKPDLKIFVFSERDSPKEYVIYDGWHTAIAFAVLGLPIPVYLGIKTKFSCFKI